MELNSFENVVNSGFDIMFITVYEKPLDFKNDFVARIFDLDKPTQFFIVRDSLEEIRKDIYKSFKDNAVRFDRDNLDQESIIEIYMIL